MQKIALQYWVEGGNVAGCRAFSHIFARWRRLIWFFRENRNGQRSGGPAGFRKSHLREALMME
jgi:hypothetical protein